ncbi:MAG: YggU family protein [Lentisphaerae bacterium GWF2_45_14]|nr:MAG: YggU family protein [Lentisphaerae bacterium GWF2_45_14]
MTDTQSIFIKGGNGGVYISCHIQPGASRSGASGLHGDSIKIKLHSPPTDGKANAELVEFIASILSVSKSSVEIKSGHSSRKKVLFVSGITPGFVNDILK